MSRIRFLFVVPLLILSLLVIGGAFAQDVTPTPEFTVSPLFMPTLESSGGDAAAPVQIKVMTYNILYGGDEIDWNQMLEAIRVTDPDIIGLQEPMGNTERIAEELGYPYADRRMHIISKFPILTPPDFDGTYVFIEVAPGQVIAMSNVHLTSDPYSPYYVRDGAPLEEVLNNERSTRLPEIAQHLGTLPNLIALDYPVVWTGDFNSPSPRDWTAAAAGSRTDWTLYPVEWPVARTIELMGMTDTYRAANPDPIARRGYTWTPAEPPIVYEDEVADRIDFVWAGGNVRVIDSVVVGEANNPEIVDVVVDPYGSDHRAVVSTLEVIPAPAPELISVSPHVFAPDDTVTVRYFDPYGTAQAVVIVQTQGLIDPAVYPIDGSGTVEFPANTLLLGLPWFAALADEDHYDLARSAEFFTIRDNRDYGVSVGGRTDRTQLSVGELITIGFTAPGNKLDWIGIYTAGDEDMSNYWLYRYTGGRLSGSVVIGDELDPYDGFPLPPGEYVARLMLDDDYVMIAESAPFTIQ